LDASVARADRAGARKDAPTVDAKSSASLLDRRSGAHKRTSATSSFDERWTHRVTGAVVCLDAGLRRPVTARERCGDALAIAVVVAMSDGRAWRCVVDADAIHRKRYAENFLPEH
jgi:hypothetical protein